MSKSGYLRAADVRAMLKVVWDCCDLGDDAIAWRQHAVGQLAKLVGAELAFSGEIAGWRRKDVKSLAVTEWGWENGFDKEPFAAINEAPEALRESLLLVYCNRVHHADGSCASRKDLMSDHDWDQSTYNQLIHKRIGIEHTVLSFQPLPGTLDEFSGQVFSRAATIRRDFSPRERTIARESLRALTGLVGTRLARLADPSPRVLPVRLRLVLSRLLAGEGDKQIARALGISRYTVNEYTKAIYAHFRVQSRAELLALWISRGWPRGFGWAVKTPL